MEEKFSVLWKRKDGYEELIPDGALVWRVPSQDSVNSIEKIGVRFGNKDSGDDRFFDEGTLYVMNGNGKTVSTFYINPTGIG